MNNKKLHQLIEYIDSFDPTNDRELMIPLEKYFDGNEETICTILANTNLHISGLGLFTRLTKLKNDERIFDIYVRFYDYQDALEDDGSWVNSDSLYFVTSLTTEELNKELEEISPDDIWEEDDLSRFINLPDLPSGCKIITAWWD